MYFDENSKEFALYNNKREQFGRGADIATSFRSKSSNSIITEPEIFMLRINSSHDKLQSIASDIKQATDYRWSKFQLKQLIDAKQKKIKSNWILKHTKKYCQTMKIGSENTLKNIVGQ